MSLIKVLIDYQSGLLSVEWYATVIHLSVTQFALCLGESTTFTGILHLSIRDLLHKLRSRLYNLLSLTRLCIHILIFILVIINIFRRELIINIIILIICVLSLTQSFISFNLILNLSDLVFYCKFVALFCL